MNVDVFISHHTASCLPVTQAICRALEREGIRCWYAPRDTSGSYAGNISEVIGQCRVFVLVLNYESSVSYDVLNEINLAAERIRRGEKLAILPFRISGEDIGKDARYYIGRVHWIDAMTPPPEERIEDLKDRIMTVLQKDGSYSAGVEMIGISGGEHPSCGGLKSTQIRKNRNFLGRKKEQRQLAESLTEDSKVFLQGMGGIGKSELAKNYAAEHREQYETVVFATYQTCLRDLILYDKAFQMEGLPRAYNRDGVMEDDAAYFARKLERLQEITDERTLLIIDNFDTDMDEDLEAFLDGRYTVIFTTRNDFSELGIPVIVLEAFAEEAELLELFRHYYRRNIALEDQGVIRQIMAAVSDHTLAVELIAKYMYHRRIHPAQMLEILQAQGIRALTDGTVTHGFDRAQSVYDNVRKLFDLDGLSDTEREILKNLSLAPSSGVELTVFGDLCALEEFADIDELIRRGWIRHDIAQDIVSLHPLIQSLIWSECSPTLEGCAVLVRNLAEKVSQLWGLPLEDKLLYGTFGKSLCEKFPDFDVEFAESFRWFAFGLSLLEQHDLSKAVCERCLQRFKEAYGEASVQVGDMYYRIADNEFHRSNVEEGLRYLNQAVSIFRAAAPGSERLGYMIKFLCWIKLGNDQEYEVTEKLLKESEQILMALLPADHPQIASQNAAYAHLYHALGQYERALAYAEESYRVFNSLHGEIHGDTLAPMSIKARILAAMGRSEEGLALYRRVIDIQIRLSGEKSRKVMTRYEVLAEIYEAMGDDENARKVLEHILTVQEEKQETTTAFCARVRDKRDRLLAKMNGAGD